MSIGIWYDGREYYSGRHISREKYSLSRKLTGRLREKKIWIMIL